MGLAVKRCSLSYIEFPRRYLLAATRAQPRSAEQGDASIGPGLGRVSENLFSAAREREAPSQSHGLFVTQYLRSRYLLVTRGLYNWTQLLWCPTPPFPFPHLSHPIGSLEKGTRVFRSLIIGSNLALGKCREHLCVHRKPAVSEKKIPFLGSS